MIITQQEVAQLPLSNLCLLLKQIVLWLLEKPSMSMGLWVTHWGTSEEQESHFQADLGWFLVSR